MCKQSPATLQDLEDTLGQYLIYLSFLKRIEPDRKLYIAIPDVVYALFVESQAIQMLLHDNNVPLIIVNPDTEEVVEWV